MKQLYHAVTMRPGMQMNVRQASDRALATILWNYMRLEQPLERADCIIGLGNADVRTADWCAHLYHQGYAPRILFTGAHGRMTEGLFAETEAEVFTQRAVELGVPAAAILKESSATNTGENIVLAHRLLQCHTITPHSLILVTKPYMLRRAYATFMKQWPDEVKPKIICSAVDLTLDEYCDADHPFADVVAIMVGDLQRIRDYPQRGFQIPQDIPDDVQAVWEELVRRGYDGQLLAHP